jgi:hypothetical protein
MFMARVDWLNESRQTARCVHRSNPCSDRTDPVVSGSKTREHQHGRHVYLLSAFTEATLIYVRVVMPNVFLAEFRNHLSLRYEGGFSNTVMMYKYKVPFPCLPSCYLTSLLVAGHTSCLVQVRFAGFCHEPFGRCRAGDSVGCPAASKP